MIRMGEGAKGLFEKKKTRFWVPALYAQSAHKGLCLELNHCQQSMKFADAVLSGCIYSVSIGQATRSHTLSSRHPTLYFILFFFSLLLFFLDTILLAQSPVGWLAQAT